MIENDKIEFIKRLMGLGELFDKKISDGLIEIYWEGLKEISLEDYIRASSQLALTCKFFPKPVEFFELIEGSQTDKANIALIQLEKAIEKQGYYSTVVFEDKVIHAVVDAMGGWMELCKITLDDWKFRKRDFISFYNTFSKRNFEYPDKLVGFHEHNNRVRGFLSHIPCPVMIRGGKKLIGGGKD